MATHRVKVPRDEGPLPPGSPLGKLGIARKLEPQPGESPEDLLVRQKKEYLRAAQIQRRRLKVLRHALKIGAVDDLELIKGNLNDYEPLIAAWSIERLLRACPWIGSARTYRILQAANIPPRAEVRRISYAKREEIARMVDEVRTAYGTV